MYSLKKAGYLAFISVACLLAFVVLLGFRQYQLTGQYNTIITQSEESIFQFATLREQITASLIENDWDKVVSASRDLNDMNSSLIRLQENELIPTEFKLDMAKQVDLSGLAISTKNSIAAEDKIAHSLNLQHQMRQLADYLLRFDRIIVSQMRAKVVHFQTIMIGALGTIICIISFSLILLYQKTVLPLIHLSEQAREDDILTTGFSYNSETCTEIAELTDTVNKLLQQPHSEQREDNSPKKHDEKLAAIINEGTNLSNGIINYAQLLSDSFQETTVTVEEKDILNKIIIAGERVAEILKKI
ncbi:MAG: hypothetical protein KKB91_02835 [Proteobacteria bacterium]|jgi:hypothetical protein|nr:hypothetical protein [Desulfocapsa sp.]MBU3945883.1 hypothetical protein [Pseudomonadota bacterium]MCG2745592.1 hypothetical protein [Desulfobacteraceae bacterium]MBU3984158.1 hypothetical protein [Pseudomonadota bacterium]MBU4027730.1 hypothetical protein [Pseudomonadota bacterium]